MSRVKDCLYLLARLYHSLQLTWLTLCLLSCFLFSPSNKAGEYLVKDSEACFFVYSKFLG